MVKTEPSGVTSGRDVYQDLVRIGERIVDFQFRLVVDRLERTDRLIRLGVATLAGMIAVIGLLVAQKAHLDTVGTGLMGSGVMLVLMVVYFLARLNTGLHREQFLTLGPDLPVLCDHVGHEGPGTVGYLRFVAEHMPIYIDDNSELIRSLSSRQGRAVLLYGMGVGLFAIAIVYIVGRFIFA